jgi:two-component system sensor histidine kinase KdpD
MIQEESDRLAQLLTNLLELTRLESGILQVEKAWQPFEEIVGSVVLRAEREGQEVLLDLPADLPLVPMDGALLQQALINLLANASRHAPGHPVELRAWREGGAFQLEVADRGPGIPVPSLDRIFDKFVRLPGGGQGGVGLGLPICRAIVQAHGGRIWAENREGGGTAFRLELPLEGPPLPPLEPEWEGKP